MILGFQSQAFAIWRRLEAPKCRVGSDEFRYSTCHIHKRTHACEHARALVRTHPGMHAHTHTHVQITAKSRADHQIGSVFLTVTWSNHRC